MVHKLLSNMNLKETCTETVEEQKTDNGNVAELYFLIQKYLSSGPLKKTAEVLLKELEEHNIFQQRLDWQGNQHNRSFEDVEHQFPFIRPDYLLQICNHVASVSGGCSLPIASKNAKSMLKFRSKKLCSSDHNFRQLYSLITRLHGIPIRDKNLRSNIVNIVRAREVGGIIPRSKFVMPKMYSAITLQRRTLGHLSSVYCLLFDSTGRYIFTGADDLLVKLWSAYTGRLLASFRGAQYEISDISVNLENTLLAAGSLDHILRVWSIQTGHPVAVLTGHNAMITTVNFCPSSCWNVKYLVSTSSDGAVAFWSYSTDTNEKTIFKSNPTFYQEKMRPGGAKMISSAFSPGGSFLATGSMDHNLRVYYMKGDEGPHRILECELHSDRVDSIQWAHSGIKFVSGSKDGTAIVWHFEDQQWKHTILHMNTRLDGSSSNEDVKKLKVTMVAWDVTDELFVTAVSDNTLKVWGSSNSQLRRVLTGHTDEVFVLECHPHDRGIMLSAGHDGQVFIWDIIKGEIISRFINSIECQGVGAIFDGKWSPDGTMVALSDSHGRIIIFGFGPGNVLLQQLPTELFFHTDYRPLLRDRNNHHVIDEQTQVPPHLMPPPFLVDIDGNPYPPALQRLVPGRENCSAEYLVPNVVNRSEGGQEVIQGVQEEDPDRIVPEEDRVVSMRNHRRSRDLEGIRQSMGEWQIDPCMKWNREILVPPLKPSLLRKMQKDIENVAQAEIDEYHKQMCSRPHMINTSHLNNVAKISETKTTKRIVKKTKFQPAIIYHPDSSEEEDLDYVDSSDYSDWVLDEGVHLEPPKRSKRSQVTHNFTEEESDEEDEQPEPMEKRKPVPVAKVEESFEEQPSTSREQPVRPKKSKPHEVLEVYKPSEWLAETKPRKSPYFPQMGDELIYLVHGHQLYVDAVIAKKIYPINMRELPWNQNELKDYEIVKIIGIRYIIRPPRVCCLKLALLDETGKLSGRYMTVKYHDVPDVLDFLVLRQSYDIAISRNWSVGDRFRCMISDEWWLGQIVSSSLEEQPNSPFLCYEIKWDNGETERMSPWDLEPVDESRVPSDPLEAVPVLEEELQAMLYQSKPEEWNNTDVDVARENILQGLSKIMELAIAEPFVAPVDLNTYPSYAYVIAYPIDLSTIRARFEYSFYRRITAAQFDIRYLASNAEKYNEKHSRIVKDARILTDLCLNVVKQCASVLDVSEIYRSMVDSYLSSDNEIEVEAGPSTSCSSNRTKTCNSVEGNEWKADALSFINMIWDSSDSIPFRQPVNKFQYPDYYTVITKPMDLTTVREKLQNNEYATPYDFADDMKLIFDNSKTYNTNPKSRIYLMTARLQSAFEEYNRKVLKQWSIMRRKRGKPKSSLSSTSSNESSVRKDPLALDDNSNATSEEETEGESTESSDDDAPLNYRNRRPKRNGKRLKLGTTTEDEDFCSDESIHMKKKQTPSSSSDEEDEADEEVEQLVSGDSSSDDDSDQPIANYRRRPKRKVKAPKYADANSSGSDSEPNTFKRDTRVKKRPLKFVSSDSESDDDAKKQRTNGESSNFLTAVSSRGRVRKLTPRAQALMKK